MRRVLGGAGAVVLCCLAGLTAVAALKNAQLLAARTAFHEATTLAEAGRYTEAVLKSEHTLALRESVLGGAHPEVAASLDQLGDLLVRAGDTERAGPLLQRALDIQEAALGENHPDVAQTLTHAAILSNSLGQAARAELMFGRARAILEAALGPNHPQVAQALDNLAVFYISQRRYAEAEPLQRRALEILEAALGPNDPVLARAVGNLALAYSSQGFHARAEPLHERVLSIQEAALGRNHPEVARTLNRIGRHAADQGLSARAEALYARALRIQEAALGGSHPDVADTLSNLGRLYSLHGQHARAEPLHWRALRIRTAAFGESHSDVAGALSSLAWTLVAQHRLHEAVPLFMRSLEISEGCLRREVLGLSESRLASFLQQLREDEERLYALLRAYPSDAGLRRLVLTTVLLRKGRSAEELAGLSHAIYQGLDTRDREAFERLRLLRGQLAELSRRGTGGLSPAEYQRRLKDLAAQGDVLEADLARRSASLRTLTALPPPASIVDHVAATLPSHAALVEWVAYLDRAHMSGAPPSQASGQLRYLALVLFADASSRAVDLGPADRIDRAAVGLNEAVARRDSGYRRPSLAFHSLALRPLLPLLGRVRHLVLAPDGQPGLLSFAAIHDGQRFLIDRFDLSYVTSGRDLLPRAQAVPPSRSVVVFASSFDPPAGRPQSWRSPAVARFVPTRGDAAGEQPWAPLPGTRSEALAIQRWLPQARLYLGPEATKQRLLQLQAPGVLHIAGHGFFDGAGGAARGTRALGHFGGINARAVQSPADPLLRSGLILSDARVTALEVAGLNLWGTQLVVMSACETGRGDVKPGQGVYGLRRAFAIAGAETVVMSLWQVRDDSTHLLMEEFYRHLLAGRGRTEALHLAARKVRETHPHPYYWAPFISVGRDGPLQLTGSGATRTSP